MLTFLTDLATILGFITLASIALALIAAAVHYGFKLVDYISLWLSGNDMPRQYPPKDALMCGTNYYTETKSDRILRELQEIHKDLYDEDERKDCPYEKDYNESNEAMACACIGGDNCCKNDYKMPDGLPPIAYTMADKYAEGKRIIRDLNRKQQNIESSIRSHI